MAQKRRQPVRHASAHSASHPVVAEASPDTVSVVVPSKNRPERLAEALHSIRAQTYPHLEVVVVNDGGDDLDAVLGPFDRAMKLVSVTLQSSLGPAGARNVGVERSTGRWITYLDDDDLFLPEHLETLIRALDGANDSAVGIAYTDVKHQQVERRDGKLSVTETFAGESADFTYDRLMVANFIPLNCVGHSKKRFVEVGGFDPSFGCLEDWELLLRLTKDQRVAHSPAATAVYRHFVGQRHVNQLAPDTLEVIGRIYQKHPLPVTSRLAPLRQQHLKTIASRVRLGQRKLIQSPTVPERLGLVKQAMKGGDLIGAETILEELLDLLPNDGELLVMLAKLRRARGLAGASQQLLETARARDPFFF